jgi:histidine ammonia-lyase
MTALRIGDEPLTPAAVAVAARQRRIEVELTPAAVERMAASHRTAERAAAERPVYGRTTGVGANRNVEVDGDLRHHTSRLLRSHAGGLGDPLAAEVVRGTMLVRLMQMAAGNGGHRPAVADALIGVLRDDALPELRDLGGLGTGDITVLAQLGLALAESDRLEIEPGDALPLMSSNAATFAVGSLAWADIGELLDAGLGVAALTFHALEGNTEAFAAPVAAARPLRGLTAVSRRLRTLTAGAREPARLQDPFGLRCLPPVAGALYESVEGVHNVLAVEINAGSENPLVAGDEILHHGGFHAATCALALEGLRLAMLPFASLSGARITHLMAPSLSGLAPFLSVEQPGSSGVLIAEYLAADALARLRAEATPSILGGVAISRGLEEHASFAWQAALQTRRALRHLRTVLALEWVVAERALQMGGLPPAGPLAPVRALAAGFDRRLEDRPIGEDAELAEAALPELAQIVRDVSGEAFPASH